MTIYRVLICLLLMPASLIAQTGIIRGKVFNKINNEAIPSANVVVQGSSIGVVTDLDGNYQINNLAPGLYNIEVSFVGFKSITVFEVQVSTSRPALVDVGLEEEAKTLDA